ncbi:MAG: hypothetical protein [Bacteriophage sp.]|nr:MAG: hypothetical protein [Bacteriophage sp.]
MNYEQLREAYDLQGLNFDEHLHKVRLDIFAANGHEGITDEAVQMVLELVLSAYAATPAKTKGGRIGRFFASVGAKILGVFKIKLNK